MSDSTANLDQVLPSQAQKEASVNALMDAASPATIFGRRASTSTLLTFGYYGGRLGGTSAANGTVSVSASNTNYIVADLTTLAVTVAITTTDWNDYANFGRMYKVTAGASSITSHEDHRAGPLGILGVVAAAGASFVGGTLTGAINEAPLVTIASTGTVNIGAAAGNTISVTGTTTITAFDSIPSGALRRVIFAGILTLAHNGTSLILPTGASITTEAGDIAEFVSLGSGNWRCTNYERASGAALVGNGGDMVLATVQVVTALKTFGTAGGAVSKLALAGSTSGSMVLNAPAVATGTAVMPTNGGNIGYLELPQNSKSAAYTTVMEDSGKHILHPSADTTARTFTIDSNANVAYPLGTAITVVNQNAGGVITIAITSDTMRLAGAGTTGSRTLAANGIATAIKITTTEWIISGTGLT